MLLIPSVIAVIGALIATLLLSGSLHFAFKIISIYALIWGLPVSLVAVFLLRRFFPQALGIRLAFLTMALFLALLIPAIFVGSGIIELRLRRSMRTAEETIAAVEKFRKTQGRYPADLNQLSRVVGPVAKPAFAPSDYYQSLSNGAAYTLTIKDPRKLLDFWEYDSRIRKWRKIE